jgi:hypothetical protein
MRGIERFEVALRLATALSAQYCGYLPNFNGGEHIEHECPAQQETFDIERTFVI